MRRRTAFLVLVTVSATAASAAFAQSDDVAKAHIIAMEHYDLGDYAAARKKLDEVLAKLTKNGRGTSAMAAKTHVLLGVVHNKQAHSKQAVDHYVKAIKISDAVKLPNAYRDQSNVALFAKARRIAKPPEATCASLPGLAHTRVTGAKQGLPLEIKSRAGDNLGAHQVVIMYRNGQTGKFAEQPMSKASGCTYRGIIAASKINGRSLCYYVVARNKKGKAIARLGSPSNPIVVQVAVGVKHKDQDTVDKTGKHDDTEVPDELRHPGKTKKGRGCACDSGPDGPTPFGLLLLLAGVSGWLLRRRRAL